MLERIQQAAFMYVVNNWQTQEAATWIWAFIALQS